MSYQLRRFIKGEPYLFTRNADGWGVCPTGKKTDRFHRSYQVYTRDDLRPLRCSCANCVRGEMWCKHLREAEAIYRELTGCTQQPAGPEIYHCDDLNYPVHGVRNQAIAAGISEDELRRRTEAAYDKLTSGWVG